MKEIALDQTLLINGGEMVFTPVLAKIGGVTGAIVISPVAMVMACFAGDSPNASHQQVDAVFLAIEGVGALTGAAIGGTLGALIDGGIYYFQPNAAQNK